MAEGWAAGVMLNSLIWSHKNLCKALLLSSSDLVAFSTGCLNHMGRLVQGFAVAYQGLVTPNDFIAQSYHLLCSIRDHCMGNGRIKQRWAWINSTFPGVLSKALSLGSLLMTTEGFLWWWRQQYSFWYPLAAIFPLTSLTEYCSRVLWEQQQPPMVGAIPPRPPRPWRWQYIRGSVREMVAASSCTSSFLWDQKAGFGIH